MSNDANIKQLITVAVALKELRSEVVFVGGSTTALLVDSVASGKARQTEDVDFIVDIAVCGGSLAAFENKMRELGFKNDTSDAAPICRWIIDFNGFDLKVDAMPTAEDIMGFTNCWYQKSIDTAWQYTFKPDLVINVIDPVYFLGTKIEAFKGRGNGNIFSHDLEDIVYVLEHRSGIEREVYNAEDDIKAYLSKEFGALLEHPDFENTLPGLLDDYGAIAMVLGKMQFVVDKCGV
ncbi:hypothetical protein [Dasania marina]|uniref:hypothetical protein n=1 Tax=Dasania marina TaxID=471499 RepID=UPI0030DCA2B4|tara:strand:- start:86224 stop:86928 length:705 start_codon:yes stop_codon:yes gene_type:complete